jgi:hypothetical protein
MSLEASDRSNSGAELPEFGGLVEQVERLDEARHNLFVISDLYCELPTDSNYNRFADSGDIMLAAAHSSVEFILNDASMSSEEKAETITTLFQDDEDERGKLFSGLSGLDFRPNQAKTADEKRSAREDCVHGFEVFISDDEIDDEEKVDGIMDVYLGGLANDMTGFTDFVANGDRARAINIAKSFGRHALEVAKIGGGVMLGAWLASRYGRQN